MLEFVYLAVILDAYLRKVIGWPLNRTLEARLTVEALQRMLGQRQPAAGLALYFDCGVQCAAANYTALLAHGIGISHSGNPL